MFRVRKALIEFTSTDLCAYVLDEPTVGLDSQDIRKVLDFIDDLRLQGKGVIVITHDEAMAAQADRMIVINDGKVIAETVKEDVGIS